MIGNGAYDYAAGSDFYVIADADVAQDFCAGAYDDVVADGGMALARFLAGAAEGDVLIHEDVVADFTGFADDDAHAVVDEEAAAYGGSGVNFDACQGTRKLRDHASEGEPPLFINAVGHA